MAITYNLITTNKQSFAYLIAFLIHVVFWGTGVCLVYVLFILREYTTFKASAYISSEYVYASLYACIAIFVICHLILVTISVLLFYGVIDGPLHDKIHFVELAVKTLAIVYCSIVLTYLFVSKLMKLSINSANMKVYDNNNYSESLLQSYHSSASDGASNGSHSLLTPSASSPMSTDEDDAKTAAPKYRSQMTLSQAVQMPLVINLELSKSEVNFLQIATKMTVLSTIMTTSSVAVLVDASVSAFYGEKWLGGFLWYFGAMLGLMIDSTVNVFCVYL
eukprot:CAMPEP_0197045142 /NCGR_PEP_ID=MMETSP1384-20130603/21072_1 /TAXON_ID=29189 /ORGANISM="Ammonia sp." /LENGTH=276 /DNA_ID=CAMNT_0042476711 /DNA_START=95 /DNA_END=921 /DNA_ORIENTATION=+